MLSKKEFIVDKSNAAANEVIRIILKNPTLALYNPVVLYGDSGVGKTHLIEVLGDGLSKSEVNTTVTNGENFIAELIYEIKNNTNFSIHTFCEKYKTADVLVVEDIQYLEDRDMTQEYLANIARYFVKYDKQIIFTMNCPPKTLETFNMQLRARFDRGLQLEIGKPTAELKMKLLENLCEDEGWNLSEEMKTKVVDHMKTPAEVIGSMKQLKFYVKEMNYPMNEELIEKILKDRTNDNVE